MKLNKYKVFFSYIFAILIWIAGVLIGGVWGSLYNESTDTNIDVIGVLCETTLPAIISVVAANSFFKKNFNGYEKLQLHSIILNGILIAFFVFVLAETLMYTYIYENIIYVIVGIVTCIVYININAKELKIIYSNQ